MTASLVHHFTVCLRSAVSRLRTFVVCTCGASAVVLTAQTQSPVGITLRPLPAGAVAEATATPAPPPAIRSEDKTLVVDQSIRSYTAKPGQVEITIPIQVYNAGTEPAVITDVKTSCGCSVPKLPSKPWILGPLKQGEFELVVDLAGKSGNLVKTATIETQKGNRVVTMQIMVPPPPAGSSDRENRDRNMQLAAADRQAIFRGDCARCHVTPAAGQMGEPLYKAACGICHEAEHRATMVPDLHRLPHETTRDFWRTMVVAGKPGTLMPGFSTDMGGPLNKTQIDSLVEYLVANFPSQPKPAGPAAAKQ